MADRLHWQLRTRLLDITEGSLMGVVNVTPDSFSDAGLHMETSAAVARATELAAAGAQIVDIGGESTRPGSDPVTEEVELDRVLPVVEAVVAAGITVSIDTSKPAVAEAAIGAGAQIVNDVRAGAESGMADLVAATGVGVVLMHSSGEPKTMQDNPSYDDVVGEVGNYLDDRTGAFMTAGVDPECIAIDPGIGFGKSVTHNLQLIEGLDSLARRGHPVVLGSSRKSFLGAVTGIDTAADRDGATAITTALGFERGARIFRVHDVAGSRVALAVTAAIVTPQQWDEWLQA